jgi:hypothetical protein
MTLSVRKQAPRRGLSHSPDILGSNQLSHLRVEELSLSLSRPTRLRQVPRCLL